ncbi:MAG TPA: presenilin family intramembrane aspartyl protease [Candidatus Aquilonibacter sp.]|nr:presenilin family intramembrane aspartyl protease [Candidatus Aquilonibacter sp.]
MIVRIENRQLVHILVLFLITQFGGLLLASLVFSTSPPVSAAVSGGSAINSTTQTLLYFGSILLFALLLLFVIRVYKGELLFRLLEAFAVVSTSFFFFLILLGYFFPTADFIPIGVVSLALAVGIILAKNRKPSLKNIVVVISSIGLGVVLGLSFSFAAAFLFLLLIAIYDYVAVFVTKHMIVFAKALSERNLAFLITASDIEVESKSQMQKEEGKEFKKHYSEMKKINNPTIQKLIHDGYVPVIAQIQLGAGDLGLPLMFAVSAYSVFANYFLSVVIVAGSAIGLIATMLFLMRYRRPLPAIPPIFAFICIALGLALPFTPLSSLTLSALLLAMGVFIIYVVMFLTLKMGEKSSKKA